jgi:hypothetical protein
VLSGQRQSDSAAGRGREFSTRNVCLVTASGTATAWTGVDLQAPPPLYRIQTAERYYNISEFAFHTLIFFVHRIIITK